jgi:hypothetical protein
MNDFEDWPSAKIGPYLLCGIDIMLDDSCRSENYISTLTHTTASNDIVRVAVSMVHVYPFLPLSDSSLTHSNLAAVLETVVKVWRLGECLNVPRSVWVKLRQQCVNDMERRNELISWWLQYSPYALDFWNWLSGQLLCWEKESALAAAKRYIHQTPAGMSVINYIMSCIINVL